MKTRLTLITEIIAPYRIPVFNALALHPEIELHVIFLAESDASLRQWRVYTDEIHFSYEVLPSVRERVGEQTLLLNWGVARALRGAQPDVLLCGGYNYLASWRAAYWARTQRIPFLLWVESTEADQRRGRRVVELFKRHFLGLCSSFVVPGRSAAQYLAHLGVPAERVFTAPNAIDLSLFQRAAAEARRDAVRLRAELQLPPRYFLNVSRLVPAKGIFDLLDAYATLEANVRSQISLVFAGDGPARAELAARCAVLNPGIVQIRGFVQRDGLPRLYALAEVLVFPTHSDTWGFVVNEAMACGIPVIASSVAGCCADLVEDGVTGVVVHSQNPTQLARAMNRLAGDANLRTELSTRGASRIAAYSPEACAEGIARAALANQRRA